jgi:hypothetical protein
MKTRLLWLLALLLILIIGALALNWNLLFPPPLSRELAAFAPADPLIFIQGSQLRAHLKRFTQRAEYAALLDSEFLASLNHTDWWPDLRENLRDFWKSLIIDPLHIIGHEMAVAVYASDSGDVLPRAILIGKTDRVARVAERVMYGYERLTGQIGITYAHTHRNYPIYVLQTYDMYWPLYYAVVGEAGLIATSLALLHETMDIVIETMDINAPSRQTAPTVFTLAYPRAVADDRVFAGYVNAAGWAEECRRNPLLRALGLGQESGYGSAQAGPSAVFTVTTQPNQLAAHIRWFAPAQASAQLHWPTPEQISAWNAALPLTLTEPVVAAGNLARLREGWHTGQRVLALPALPPTEATEGAYGDRLECRVSERVFGVLYALPDIECLIDAADVQAAEREMDAMVRSVLRDMLPPLLHNSIEVSVESYGEAALANVAVKMPLIKHNILHYAVITHPADTLPAAAEPPAVSTGYAVISNSLPRLKHRLDMVAADPAASPYSLAAPAFSETGFLAVLSPTHTVRLIQHLAQTATWAFVVPAAFQEPLKQALPLALQGAYLLPPVTVAGDAVAGQLILDIRLHLDSAIDVIPSSR